VNYRTTEQIRRFADRIVRSSIDAGAGEPEQRTSVSLLSGPEPEVQTAGTVAEEIETIAAWLTALLEAGVPPGGIVLFGRTESSVSSGLKGNQIHQYQGNRVLRASSAGTR